jgi:hypothetical protein
MENTFVYLVWLRNFPDCELETINLIGIRQSMDSAVKYLEAAKVLYPLGDLWVEKLEVEP